MRKKFILTGEFFFNKDNCGFLGKNGALKQKNSRSRETDRLRGQLDVANYPIENSSGTGLRDGPLWIIASQER